MVQTLMIIMQNEMSINFQSYFINAISTKAACTKLPNGQFVGLFLNPSKRTIMHETLDSFRVKLNLA